MSLTPSSNSSLNFFSSGENSNKIKLGNPVITYITTTKDMFYNKCVKSRMDKLSLAKKFQEEYINIIEKRGGDIHYYKKQTFPPGYSGMNNKGGYIPQYAFDQDPIEFFKKYMDTDNEFEYLGLVEHANRKGEKKTDHHKILVKPKILRSVLEEHIINHESYIPESGKVCSYQKFFSFICLHNTMEKKRLECEKEKKSIAKKNSDEGIDAMEEKALENVEKEIDKKKKKVKERLVTIDSLISTSINLSEVDRLTNQKNTLNFEITEIDKERINKRRQLGEYYDSIRILKGEWEVRMEFIKNAKNAKKRRRRAVSKSIEEEKDKDEDEGSQDMVDEEEVNSLDKSDIDSIVVLNEEVVKESSESQESVIVGNSLDFYNDEENI